MPPTNLSPADQQRLDALYERLRALSPRNVGFPCNQAFDYSELFRFLEFSANNVGDPFHSTNYRLNTMEFEREMAMTALREESCKLSLRRERRRAALDPRFRTQILSPIHA